MIAIVDYGVGNVQAFANIFRRGGVSCSLAKTAKDFARADKIVLPGVGAFDWAMQRLNDSGMRGVLDDLVVNKSVPVLGVCVGMQIMANGSEEGNLPGLGWIDADVLKFKDSNPNKKILYPHMGWNAVHADVSQGIFNGIEEPLSYYFLHSYYICPHQESEIYAITNYHRDFASGIKKNEIYGVQFHPEKSHEWGVKLLLNFASI